MTNSDSDNRKKRDEFAKNLVHTMFGLDKLPSEVGGEVLFDDYDDAPAAAPAEAAVESNAAADVIEAAAQSSGARTEYQDDIDDLIMFPEDDDHDDVSAVADDDDENFDFGSDDDEDDEDDEDDVVDEPASVKAAEVSSESEADAADEFGFDSEPAPPVRETSRSGAR